jgi:hypothetical protein
MKSWRIPIACAALSMTSMAVGASPIWQGPAERPKSPVVLAVGCAREGAQPNIWILSHVGERLESARPGITTEEVEHLSKRPLGQNTYELIGVADFVDAAASQKIGVRGQIFAGSRINATGMLANGHKVAVKGLFIQGPPARINLTSVVGLDPQCP